MIKNLTFEVHEDVLGIDAQTATIIDQEAVYKSISHLAKFVVEDACRFSLEKQQVVLVFGEVLRARVVEYEKEISTNNICEETEIYLDLQSEAKPSIEQPASPNDFVVHFEVKEDCDAQTVYSDDVEVSDLDGLMKGFELALKAFHQKVEELLN